MVNIFWLVASTPLKNMSSSVGMFIPNRQIKNVPYHQPVADGLLLKHNYFLAYSQ
jgi:hypothetical protein